MYSPAIPWRTIERLQFVTVAVAFPNEPAAGAARAWEVAFPRRVS